MITWKRGAAKRNRQLSHIAGSAVAGIIQGIRRAHYRQGFAEHAILDLNSAESRMGGRQILAIISYTIKIYLRRAGIRTKDCPVEVSATEMGYWNAPESVGAGRISLRQRPPLFIGKAEGNQGGGIGLHAVGAQANPRQACGIRAHKL